MGVTEVKLSETEKYEKFQLASVAGYKVIEDKETRMCYIDGADNYIDNYFPNIDAVLRVISSDLIRKGFAIA